MMRGIRLSHGAIFVTDGVTTVRILPSGEVEISPILFFVLEADLSHEPPTSYEYFTEGEILSLPERERILEIFSDVKNKLNK